MPPSSNPRSGSDLPIPTWANWGEVHSVTALPSGANNDILRVEFSTGTWLLKKTRATGICRLQNEQDILHALQGCHAPRPALSASNPQRDPSFIWMSLVPGQHHFELDSKQAEQLGQALRHIHGLDISSLGHQLEAPEWEAYFENRLLAQLEQSAHKAPRALYQSLASLLMAIHQYGLKLGSVVNAKLLAHSDSQSLATHRTLVHTDIIPLNVLFEGDSCTLIDWELGRIDFPEWDLVSIEKSFRFQTHAHQAFHAAYGQPIHEERYRFLSLLHYANVALWRIVSFYVRGENQAIARKFLEELDAEVDWIRANLK